MIELTHKYVFHIPLYKFEDNELVEIEIDGILNDLLAQFHENGFESLYMAKVKSFYKSRLYDELLITLFSDDNPEEIFIRWFRNNNDMLSQEAFAYELNDKMYIISD